VNSINLNRGKLQHGEFNSEYIFEDLSAKILLCNKFNDDTKSLSSGDGFREKVIDSVKGGRPFQPLDCTYARVRIDFINADHLLTRWSTMEKSLKTDGNLHLEEFENYFTIAPGVVSAATGTISKLTF
jgi:hypothetical protein